MLDIPSCPCENSGQGCCPSFGTRNAVGTRIFLSHRIRQREKKKDKKTLDQLHKHKAHIFKEDLQRYVAGFIVKSSLQNMLPFAE
jgi:hypothetical protein